MAIHLTTTIELPSEPIVTLRSKLDRDDKRLTLRAVVTFLLALLGGAIRGYARTVASTAHATGYYDCVVGDAVHATDTVTILGTALSYVANPATTAQFTYTVETDDGLAAGLAACINANATLNRFVRAKAVANRCHVTCLYPSTLGNAVTLAETGNGFTRSAAALAGGAADAVYGAELGYVPAT